MSVFHCGAEVFLRTAPRLGNIAVVTNDTGRLPDGTHEVEELADLDTVRLNAIFSPEHGFGSDAPDGEHVGSSRHDRLHIPIHSLYGPNKTPSEEQLQGIDAVLYDIQDVGVRFYTYISTLKNVLEACSRLGIPLHVLDRPNPIGGTHVEGPMVAEDCRSFVSHLDVPIRYGLTPGELARYLATDLDREVDLTVWPCEGYARDCLFAELGIPWFKPSPSMPSVRTALFYPGTCLFEGLNVSEGRGTEAPFQILGAPWIDGPAWAEALAPRLRAGVNVAPTTFQPTFAKYEGQECSGIMLDTRLRELPDSIDIGLQAIAALLVVHADEVCFTSRPTLEFPFFDYLAGNHWVRESLLKGAAPADLTARMTLEHQAYRERRARFFLY